jgi:UDP-glucose 4-epimerase
MTHDPEQLPLNFRSGQGQSALEVIAAFEAASHQSIADTVIDRWAGDAAITVTNPSQPGSIQNCQAKRSLQETYKDGGVWECRNLMGYRYAI